MKDLNKTIPMKLLMNARAENMNALRWLEFYRSDLSMKWHRDWCYIPSAAAMHYLAKTDTTNMTSMEIAKKGTKLACIASWRKEKNIYEFDTSVGNILYREACKELKVTSDMLTLPVWNMYLKINNIPRVDGMFVFFEDNLQEGRKELRILPITTYGSFTRIFNLFIPEVPAPLDELIERQVSECVKCAEEMNTFESDDRLSEFTADFKKVLYTVVPMLLYMASDNALIRQVNKSTFIRTETISDTKVEIANYAVGERVGIDYRKLEKELLKDDSSKKSPEVQASFETYIDENGVKRLHWNYSVK